MALKRGDIVLVPFPFTDLTSRKVRPAVVVSSDPQGEDIIIAFISSVVPRSLTADEFLLASDNPDFSVTGLKKSSVFKMNKLLTISSSLVIRRLGSVHVTTLGKLSLLLKKALGL